MRAQKGFTLVEMMVALVAAMVVSAAVLSFAFVTMKTNGEYVQSTRLTQELRNSLDLMTRELRRSGYNNDALGGLTAGTQSDFGKILISGSCIIYSYAKDGSTSSTTPSAALGEIRGIRRITATVAGRSVGIVEFADSSVASPAAKPTCGGSSPTYTGNPPYGCNSTTGWCAMSDPTTLDVTALSFTDNRSTVGTSPNQVQLRDIGVSITGRLAGNTDYTRDMQSSVRIRSDCWRTTLSDCSTSP